MTNLTPSHLLSDETFRDWLDHPATKALKVWLAKRREDEKERWADGDYVTPDPVATAIRQAAAIGQCKLCAELLALEYEQIVDIEGEIREEHKRAETPGPGGAG